MLSIPMDSVSPGSTLPLFPEENLKLLSALVHPLDSNSVPYNFSSSTFPMLHSAARALNLPARSSTSYLAVFGASTPAASMHSSRSSSASSNTAAATPLDDRYTGKILVSGYNIAFVLPRDFPPRFVGEESALRVSTFSAAKMRRSSISERGSMHFMAAIHLLVPFTSRPPRAPFLISIPLPRCLSNNVRLHIFPPTQTSTSASVASLSSAEEDPGSWELTSEPHVARTTTRPSRSGSYGNIADDESSDSTAYATSASGGIIIQGTFPSTERLRIRWAQPTKNVVDNADGRRRVGVKEVKGDMTTLVMGKAEDPSSGREGVLMKLEYKGSCKGVWFPGVATMLGMDVGLDARGSDVIWAPGEEDHWSVSGGVGYTGFDVGPPSAPVTRQPSLEFPSAPTNTELLQAPPLSTSSSTSSLLRAPLPADQIPDYSFEGSPISLTPSGTLSSLSSVPLTPEGRSRTPSDDQPPGSRLPAAPITIHINMNDLIPPAKNVFTFAISGTILVIPKTRSVLANGHTFRFNSGLENEAGPIPIVLPRFTVLAADSESTSTIIRNGTESATVEVYRIAGDLQDAQTRRTVLQPSSMTRCGSDGCRIALRSIAQLAVPIRSRPELALDSSGLSPRARTPTGHREATIGPHPSAHTQGMLIRRRRNGPLMIPSVHIIVTPLCVDGSEFPNGHAVHMHMHAPSDADSEWLEFGIARAAGSASSSGSPPSDTEAQPEIDIVTVSVDGIPVRFENRALGKQDQSTAIDLGPSFAEKNRSHWITWIKVHVGEGGGHLTVDYVAKHLGNDKSTKDVKGKSRATDQPSIDLLIPTFALAVGRMDVIVESTTGKHSDDLDLVLTESNP
ncbi:hypothetical protein ID866_4357 [Astraeus odoratus]|nr:hypothetical protein ID866_4357 [Astraeus odoratus]